MELVIVNQAHDHSVYRYKKDYQTILERTCTVLNRPGDWTLSVIFVTPEEIHEINRSYRHVDRATDVISFALQDDMSDAFGEEDEYELGDIFINVQAIRDQAAEYGHSQRREACFLFCHGLLHLMGYDHMTPEDEKEMFHLQDVILDEVVHR
ncbi:rRNA maturation RNase YbeY [Catenisphaera adipataccumulans]|uniref:Endoribonuclease YbeY n=1 Tax=Catenisphaera adipataccumulans TaxID=700500 RepID=A0A7W8FX10_9FIRM|nr:rRNA maturation RNase YbeY [Catenisphaera adipataccumulans]MBB5183190.1 putative rRNA maturation factor [Catenisphaera adipataccumulans]